MNMSVEGCLRSPSPLLYHCLVNGFVRDVPVGIGGQGSVKEFWTIVGRVICDCSIAGDPPDSVNRGGIGRQIMVVAIV